MTNVKMSTKGQAFLSKVSSMKLAKQIALDGRKLYTEGVLVKIGDITVSAKGVAQKTVRTK